MQRCSASRSAVPRETGKPPSADRNHATGRRFHSESLPMNRSRRRVRHDAIGVSMFERWTGASTNAPVVGMCSRPSMPIRVHSRVNPATNARATE